VTQSAGLFRSGYFYGVTIGDYNNDGFEDIFVTGWEQNTLYRNNGDGTFSDVTKQAGLLSPQPRFGSGCAFLDYDRDGKLDLFVANYLTFDMKTAPQAGNRMTATLKMYSVDRAASPMDPILSIATMATAPSRMSHPPPA